MAEPIYEWVCTYCGASDVAESPEMARLAINVHVDVAHRRASSDQHEAASTVEDAQAPALDDDSSG